nr:hypothetical protein [uncultured Treponema sp.]
MKKCVLFLALMFISRILFAEEDIFRDNGKLLERTESEEQITELWKFEIRNYKGGDNLFGINKLYDDHNKNKIVGELKWYKELFNVHKLYTVKNLDDDTGELWFEISTKSIKGWICYSTRKYWDFFKNKNYIYLETIQNGNKKWNIRKLEQVIAYMVNSITVMDKPGSNGKIIGTIDNEKGFAHHMYAITEETEKVDGCTDYWIKICYDRDNDKYGWIHGSKVYVERGGPKYRIPEDYIKFLLGDMV